VKMPIAEFGLVDPRGAPAPLSGSEAKASRGLEPALHGLFAAKPRCATTFPNPTARNVETPGWRVARTANGWWRAGDYDLTMGNVITCWISRYERRNSHG
jgi:hypothetical protein